MQELLNEKNKRPYQIALISVFLNILLMVYNGYLYLKNFDYWYGSFMFHYFLLAITRIYILYCVSHRKQMKRYLCALSIMFNSVILGTTVDVVYRLGRTKVYNGYFVYAMALYTFFMFGNALINYVKAKKDGDPYLKDMRKVGFADGFVSMYLLETGMLNAFNKDDVFFNSSLNRANGAVICLIVFLIGLFSLKQDRKTEELSETQKL